MKTMEDPIMKTYDIVIKNGEVIDPQNQFRTIANIGLSNGKIGVVTRVDIKGKKVIDATGKIVCPGFIDIHSHLDSCDYAGELSVLQGITTSLTGNCGISEFPIKSFLDETERKGYILNEATLVGHSWKLRELVGLVDPNAVANEKQISQMAEYAEQALSEGAVGISLGLQYAPASTKKEILALAKVVAKYDKFMPIHTRLDAYRFAEGLKEVFDISEATGAKVHISHLGYQCGFGQMDLAMRMIENMWKNGYKITCDSGAYEAFCTYIGSESFAPGWTELYGCSLNDLVVCSGPYAGQRCSEEIYNEIRETAPMTSGTAFVGKYHEFIKALQQPYVVISTDAGLAKNPGEGHPQDTGTFPKVLGSFVRELGALTLMEAIRKSTILPAEILGLKNKGWMGVGADADIVIFDPNRVIDVANYLGLGRPDAPPLGIEYVLVNGVPVVAEGKLLKGEAPGRVIRKENEIWMY